MAGERQWIRYFRLMVAKDNRNEVAIDLSEFRVRFHITQAATGQPCTAKIRIYNVSDQVVNSIETPTSESVKHGHSTVIIDAGYQEHHSVIFKGALWWKTTGRDSETDDYLELIATAGDRAHQHSIVRTSLPAGSTQADIFRVVARSMEEMGVGVCKKPDLMTTALPRGKVLYGMSRDFMQGLADTNQFLWGYATEGLATIPAQGEDKAANVVVLNAASGLLDRPLIGVDGLKCRALLNPDLEFGKVVQIDTKTIQTPSFSTSANANSVNENLAATGAYLDPDGFYKIVSRVHSGDTRGDEWFTDLICTGVGSAVPVLDQGILNFTPNQK